MLKRVQHDILGFFGGPLDSFTSFALKYFTWIPKSLPAGRQARPIEPFSMMG